MLWESTTLLGGRTVALDRTSQSRADELGLEETKTKQSGFFFWGGVMGGGCKPDSIRVSNETSKSPSPLQQIFLVLYLLAMIDGIRNVHRYCLGNRRHGAPLPHLRRRISS